MNMVQFIYSLVFLIFLASCSGSGTIKRQMVNTDDFTELSEPGDIYIDALGVLPLDHSSSAGYYTLRVNNSGLLNYSLVSVKIGAEQAEPVTASSKLLKVNASLCQELSADSSCELQLTPYTSTSADVLILLNFRDVYGAQKEVRQMVRMSQGIKHSSGFAISNDLTNLITTDGSYSLALPVILERDFESIAALNGDLRCQDPGFRQGNYCSYLIKGKALADNTLLTTQLTGFAAGKKIAQTQANILISNKPAANLILSHGVSLSTDGWGSSDLSIYNNGTAPAAFKISVDAGVEIVAGQECLNQALAAQNECRISLRSKGKQGQRASAFIVYYDEKSVSTTLNYINPAQKPLLNISSSNSLQNTPVSTSNQQILTITNTSDSNLNGIAVAIVGAKPAHLTLGLMPQVQGGCNTLNDITLAVGASCRVALHYSPTESENSATQLQVSLAVAEQKAEQQAELYNYSLDYSAIKPTNYLAISLVKNVTLAATKNSTQEEESFSLTNLAPAIPLQLNQVMLEDLSAQLQLKLESCGVGTILDEQHPECVGRINYNSVISDITPKSAHLAVLYGLNNMGNSDVYSQSNSFTFIRESSSVIGPLIPDPVFESGVKIIESFVVEVNGEGATVQEHELATEPYRVFLTHDKVSTITLKYTFTNIGDKSATNFRVDENNEVVTALTDALNNAGVNSAITPHAVSVNKNCSNVLAAKGGSCTVQFMWTGTMKAIYDVSIDPITPQFSLGMELCYAKDTEGSHVCQAVLQKEKLDVIVSEVSDPNVQISSTKALFWEMLGGIPSSSNKKSMKNLSDLDTYFPFKLKGILTLNNLNKYSFKTKPKANKIKVEVRDNGTLVLDHNPGHPPITVKYDYIAGAGECNLVSNSPCSIKVEYRDYTHEYYWTDPNCPGAYKTFLSQGLAATNNFNFNSCQFQASFVSVKLDFIYDDSTKITRGDGRLLDWRID